MTHKETGPSAATQDCFICGGDGTIEVRPAGYGHSDDLAEYEPCFNCNGSGQTKRNDPAPGGLSDRELAELFRDSNVRVLFGLKAQGHIPTIERMLAAGDSWNEIGKAIGWDPETAKQHYERTSTIEIKLRGAIPAKKNRWTILRSGRSSGIGLRKGDQDAIDSLTLQAQSQYRGDPLEHPDIEIYPSVTSRRPDRDNLVTTVLDVLVASGVLKDDNVARCNGWLRVAPARIVSPGEEVCTIVLFPSDLQETDSVKSSTNTSRNAKPQKSFAIR